MEPLVHEATCRRGNKPTIEAFGFGKGYKEADQEWRQLFKAFELLRARGINVILCAHAQTKMWKNPDATQGDYDRHTLKLHERASGLAKEWSKVVLYADFETATVEKDNRTKGIDTGRRLAHTRRTAAYDAKNRLWLPPELPLGWQPFVRAVRAGTELRGRFYEAIAHLDAEAQGAAIEYLEQHDYQPEAAEQVIAGLSNPQ